MRVFDCEMALYQKTIGRKNSAWGKLEDVAHLHSYANSENMDNEFGGLEGRLLGCERLTTNSEDGIVSCEPLRMTSAVFPSSCEDTT
jgi:hypothetical protein